MRNRTHALLLAVLSLFLLSTAALATPGDAVPFGEPFKGAVLIEGLNNPWDIVWGPDNMLWVTERLGRRILRIHPETGKMKVLTTIEEAHAEGGHEGVLGLAIAPDLAKDGGDKSVYVVYTYRKSPDKVENARKRIVRFQYDSTAEMLKDPVTILDEIPAGDDHNGGRIIIGPDDKLYLSLGELGHNQGANLTKVNEAQRLPTQAEVNAKKWDAYVGKVLRINRDGSVPADNPVLREVQSHVFTYGHRNPQGLCFIGENLFSCEHGPSVDDEINLLIPGGNYGWPLVAGYRDNMAYYFADWSRATQEAINKYDPNVPNVFPSPGVPVQRETDWADTYIEPVKTFHTVPNNYNFKDSRFTDGMEYIYWPTVAPSSIIYYPENGAVPSWRNSMLMTTLKSGALYRLPMNMDKKTLQGSEFPEFRTANRYRAACINGDGSKVFIITDKAGNARDMNFRPTTKMQNPGAVLVFTYTGAK